MKPPYSNTDLSVPQCPSAYTRNGQISQKFFDDLNISGISKLENYQLPIFVNESCSPVSLRQAVIDNYKFIKFPSNMGEHMGVANKILKIVNPDEVWLTNDQFINWFIKNNIICDLDKDWRPQWKRRIEPVVKEEDIDESK